MRIIYLVLFKLALKFFWWKIGGKYKHFKKVYEWNFYLTPQTHNSNNFMGFKWVPLKKVLEVTAISSQTQSCSLQDVCRNFLDGGLTISGCKSRTTCTRPSISSACFHFQPEVKIEGVQIWAVSRPVSIRTSANNSSSKLSRNFRLVCAVWWCPILHPP